MTTIGQSHMSSSTPSELLDKVGSVAEDFPPDPLLGSGSFISSTTGDGSVDRSKKQRIGVPGLGERVTNEMASGQDPLNSSPDSSVPQAESKSRKRPAIGDNWLPPGWRVEDRVRTSGATAGTVDKYYHEPVTGRMFRSRTEVLYYLEHGTPKRGAKKADNVDANSDHFVGQVSNKSSRKAKEQPQPQPPPSSNFDFENPPEKVTWTNEGDEAWIPVVGDNKVQDEVRREWSTAFTFITSRNPSNLSS